MNPATSVLTNALELPHSCAKPSKYDQDLFQATSEPDLKSIWLDNV